MKSLWLRLEHVDQATGRIALFDVPFPPPDHQPIVAKPLSLAVLQSDEWNARDEQVATAAGTAVGLFDDVGDALRNILDPLVLAEWANRRDESPRTYLEVIRCSDPWSRQEGVRQLADLPWEYLAEKKMGGLVDRYFAEPWAPLLRARRGRSSAADADADAEARQLNILVVTGEAIDWVKGGFPADDVGAVLREFQRCELCAHVELLEVPTLADLEKAFDRLEPDLVHFTGHGELSDQTAKPALRFNRAIKDERWWFDMAGIRTFLRNRQRKPRLVVLNACNSAKSPAEFYSVQEAIMEAGVPAVVAAQAPIQQAITSEFSQVFYGQLLEGKTVDRAVAQARLQLGQAGGTRGWDWRDWGLPVLSVSIPPEDLLPPKPAHLTERLEMLRNCAVLKQFMRHQGLPAPFVGLGWPKERWKALKALRNSNCLVIKGPPKGGKSCLVMRTLRDAVQIGHDVKYVAVCGGGTPALNFVELLSAIVDADTTWTGSEVHKALNLACFEEFEKERRSLNAESIRTLDTMSIDRIVAAFERGLQHAAKEHELTIVLDEFQRDAACTESFPAMEFKKVLSLVLRIAKGAIPNLRLILVLREALSEAYGLAVLPGEPINLSLFSRDDIPMLFHELCRFYRKDKIDKVQVKIDKIRDAAMVAFTEDPEHDATCLVHMGQWVGMVRIT